MSESADMMPKGPYTLWQNFGYEGWSFQDFDTLHEAVKADKHVSAWVITKPVDWDAKENPGAGDPGRG